VSRNINKSMNHKNDERKTPAMLVDIIAKYIPHHSTVWCPFDTVESQFVKVLAEKGHIIHRSHIDDGYDFFKRKPPTCDCIVSNPPFSKKLDVFQRLFDLDVPFAMLMNLECLNYQAVGEFFFRSGKQLQLLIPDKKVSFDGNTSSFNSSYFCYKLLPKDLMFCHLEHNNSGKHFRKEN